MVRNAEGIDVDEIEADFTQLTPEWMEDMERRIGGADPQMYLYCRYQGGMINRKDFDPSVRDAGIDRRWCLHYSSHTKRKRDGFCPLNKLDVKSIVYWADYPPYLTAISHRHISPPWRRRDCQL